MCVFVDVCYPLMLPPVVKNLEEAQNQPDRTKSLNWYVASACTSIVNAVLFCPICPTAEDTAAQAATTDCGSGSQQRPSWTLGPSRTWISGPGPGIRLKFGLKRLVGVWRRLQFRRICLRLCWSCVVLCCDTEPAFVLYLSVIKEMLDKEMTSNTKRTSMCLHC